MLNGFFLIFMGLKKCEPSYILKQQCLSVCLSVWAVLGRLFQSLPVPCGAGL